MRRFKIYLVAALVILVAASPVIAGKMIVESSDKGQFTDLIIRRASSSTVSGNEGTIDLETLTQPSTTGAEPVVNLVQSDVDEATINFSCTEGTNNCVSCYTTTSGSKRGTIKIEINGATRYLQFYGSPN